MYEEAKYLLREKVVFVDTLAWWIWKYETGGKMFSPCHACGLGWHDYDFPEQLKDMYRTKAMAIMEFINEQQDALKE